MAVIDLKTSENAALMRKFCSLGANCEFGVAQRRCGAEPLDVLRWAWTPTDVLLRLMRSGFANIADDLDVIIGPGRKEHAVRSKRYGFTWHAFTRELSPEQILRRERARLPRLAEMLLDYVWEGDRIFVRHYLMRDESPREIAEALRRIGPNAVLLHVRPATPLHPDGSVVYQGDGLLTGFIDQFADAANIPGTTRAASWLELCINALQVRDRWLPWREPAGPRPDFNPGLKSTVPAPTVPAPTVPAPTVPAPTVPAPTVPANDTNINATRINGNGASALSDWAALDASLPGYPALLLASIQALLAVGRCAEAGVLLDAAQFRYPYYAPFAIAAARTAQRQGADHEARRRWQAVRDRFPTAAAAGIIASTQALRDAGHIEDAEALLAEAIIAFPDDPAAAIEQARLAQVRRDWPDALRRWSAIRQRFPNQPHGYSGAAVAHRQSGEFDAADALLRHAMERFPDLAWLAVEYGWVAHVRHDWPEAVIRWQAVRARVPDTLVGYTSEATALRELGRMEEAEAVLRDAAERFPDDPRVLLDQARLVQARRDWPEAERRWAAVRARLPDEEAGYTSGARALREQGRGDEADQLLREAIARFPERRKPLTEHAWLAHIRRDWPAAVERWAVVRAHFPRHAEAYLQAAHALRGLGRDAEAEPLLVQGQALLSTASG
jgi:predicted Zn-dependent protease